MYLILLGKCLAIFVIFLTKCLIANTYFDLKTCGTVHESRVRIVNGVPSPVQYSWFVAFYIPDISELSKPVISIDCGGALVTRRHVVTAGHCYKGVPEPQRPSHYNIAFNLVNRCGGSRDEVRVRRVIVHGLFEENWQLVPENDVAIVVLSNDINNTPICLPTRDSYNRFYGTTVGFGSTNADPGDPKFPCDLLSANLLINTREHCLKTNYFPETLAYRTVCAHSPGYRIDPCFADSGGPLMVYNNGRFELVGILSYGRVCAGDNWPKIYTDTTDLGQGLWIKEQIFGLVSKWFFSQHKKHYLYRYYLNNTRSRVPLKIWKDR